MITLFVDTNLFLQCKDIKSLKWGDLFPKKTLKLLIPRAVQKEIDEFKGQGSSRRSKKARATSTYFKEILKSKGGLTITSKLSIDFPSRKELSTVEREITLDTNKNDDSIVQDILSYQKLHPNEVVSLLTNDSGLMVTAREYGITFTDIPESWLLEPEPDDKDKKINDLEKRIKYFEGNFPVIKIQAYTNNTEITSPLTLKVIEFPALSDLELDELMDRIKNKNPMKTSFDEKPRNATSIMNMNIRLLDGGRYTPPSEASIREYTETLYPSWIEKVRENLKDLHSYIYWQNNKFFTNIIISNNGQLPAEGVLFDISISENFILHLPSEGGFLDKDWKFPNPPKAPEGKIINSYSGLEALTNVMQTPKFNTPALLNPTIARDKNSFYWKGGKPSMLSRKLVMECEEFRHQMNSEETTLRIMPVSINRPTGGQITCSVSAKNLPNPEKISIIMKIEYELGNTYEEALKLINV